MIVYYSGHADADALHLDGTHLPLGELRDLVTGSAASARVLVLDACRSGTITRVKGGTPAPAFDIDLGIPVGAEGVAILSSSAAGESSQESDALGASFFTHALVSALLGAGDTNHDGSVTLGEAFAYAKERTLAATSRTIVGPQHPTFRLDSSAAARTSCSRGRAASTATSARSPSRDPASTSCTRDPRTGPSSPSSPPTTAAAASRSTPAATSSCAASPITSNRAASTSPRTAPPRSRPRR